MLTSSRSIEGKLSNARRIFKEEIELIFVDAPNVLVRPTLPYDPFSDVETMPSPDEQPRTYWPFSSNYGFPDMKELDAALYYMRSILDKVGPVDGVFGFSMGGATAGFLAAVLERPWLHPAFAFPPSDPSAVWPIPPLQFVVACAGYVPRDERCKKYFDPPLSTPSLHIIGKGDVVAGQDDMLALVDGFSSSTVIWHEGGHWIPRQASFNLFLRNFMLAQMSPQNSPTTSPSVKPERQLIEHPLHTINLAKL
ncbi:hypothetical protein JCM8097_009180 [Rhodosporidiobolus ruineniae]